ncbi:MAG TPA: thiamine pyrophosphate-dependent enzyme [Thermodesulfobacteriota bacterium]|nr:thiamine pyrophosphate-dependent enzyme [Thermodesulfobacteriota bacterium]
MTSKPFSRIIAQALYDAAASVITNVPGFGGTQVFDAYCDIAGQPAVPCFHEEIAYSLAHGASLAGKRSAALLKGHGLAKAANSVVDSLSAGTTAGFVVLVFDDKYSRHSDSILNVSSMLRGLGIPFHRLRGASVYHEVLNAFMRSEMVQLPIALLITADDLLTAKTYSPTPLIHPELRFERNVAQHVLSPLTAGHQHRILNAKLNNEQWDRIPAPELPSLPYSLPPEWQDMIRPYQAFFDAFRHVRSDIVTGDTGVTSLFAFSPYDCIDICTYMGGSIPLALGAYLAGYTDVWALTGDFSFIAAGHLGLAEALQRRIPLKLVIFHNSQAQTTGGQAIPSGVLETILKGYEDFVVSIENPHDSIRVKQALVDVKEADALRIVVVEYDT